MVVFCGRTYLSRLWCIVELFTYVHMGGSICSIEFEPVLRRGHENEDLRSIAATFEAFDAQQCTCFLTEDKDRMLDIICSAYGDLRDFNKAVREIFRYAKRPEAQASSDSDDE